MSIQTNFLAFEKHHSLFDIHADGIPVWERIRNSAYNSIRSQNGHGQAHSNHSRGISKEVVALRNFIINIFHKNPYLSSQSEILFVGHPRRKKLADGKWWDLYCDPLHEAFSTEYLHVENPVKGGHQIPTPTPRLRYLDTIKYTGLLQQKLGIREPTLNIEVEKKLESAANEIESEFNANIDLVAKAEAALHRRRTLIGLYKKFVRRVSPSLVVVVVGYSNANEILIEACKDLNIPTVEIQHGVISDHHFGYSFPDSRNKRAFADYLLTWGDFWGDGVEFPIPDERVIPTGYPYLDQSVNEYNHIRSQDKIIFLSQGTIGAELSKFALEVDRHPDVEHDVVYKLHPGEYDRWRDEYPWLIDADFEVIDCSEPPLYQLFAESNVQIGVYSTAVYEGLAFDLETYVYDCPGSSTLDPLIEENSAKLISSSEELVSLLGTNYTSFDSGYYFAPNATEHICEVLNRLIDEGTSYQSYSHR